MNPHAMFLRECDKDDLYELAPESGLDPAETAQMREADTLNDEIPAAMECGVDTAPERDRQGCLRAPHLPLLTRADRHHSMEQGESTAMGDKGSISQPGTKAQAAGQSGNNRPYSFLTTA